MEINWFTVIAQIINFLILVWLLKRFLYKPVLNAIDEREKKIAGQLSDAEAKKTSAQKERDEFEQKNKTFDNERAEKMNEMQEEIGGEKQRLFEEVRNESNALRSKYEDSMKQQEQDITDTLKRKTKEEVFAIAGKALADIADVSIEEQAIKVFIRKIRKLSEDAKTTLKQAFKDGSKEFTIKSAFELSSKPELEKVIEEIIGQKTDFKYHVQPQLLSGIEIDTGSYQLSWNIESYLGSLKESITTKEKENASV